jgi:four helix bundle protein
MASRPEELRDRTKLFALRVVRLFQALPKSDVARTLGRQLLRSGTSVAANYRAVCRARSRAEFIAKMGIVLEEADETVFWLEMLIEADVMTETRLGELLNEANELVRVFAASVRTAKRMTHPIAQSPDRSIVH